MKSYFISILAAFLLFGCASYRPVPTGTAAITITKVEERAIRMGARVTLPAGDYLPDFESDRGTYYLAPTSVTIRNLGFNVPLRGGLLIPPPTAKDKRHAAWVQQVGGGTALGVLLSGGGAAIEVFPFDEPIGYSLKK